jgi:membrane protein DedA with SNARE-associated domain
VNHRGASMTETFPWPIQDIAEWMPLSKAAGFFLATFVLEDLAAVGAGLLLAAGAISWPVAFASCFLGIWLGDGGLYALARFGGRKWFEQSSLKRFASKVSHCEEWFAECGVYVLIFSRCVPGARLPTYLAAGFLRLPLLKFLTVTGTAAFVWTYFILRLAETLGAQLVHWLNAYKHGSLIFLGVGAALFFLFQLLRRTASTVDLRQVTVKLERWRHWEFWPAWIFYPPVALYCVWLAIKYRGLTVATVSNPGILSGGLVGESKMVTLKALAQTSPQFTATAELVIGSDFETRLRSLEELRSKLDLPYPFILKPDLGQRGAGVKLIRTQLQAVNYLRHTTAPLLVQRFAPGPFEAGIFYYRFPHEPHGKIFAITEKIFPVVVGDGRHTIAELIERDVRARLIADIYLKRLAPRQDEVPPAGESVRLVEAGNHAQGCIFRDGQRLWSPELEARIDEISQKLDGFYIGRYDIRYPAENDLRAGRNFQTVELNGASSEATSIYDARNSLRSAYRTLFQQWDLVFAIGAANRRRGFSPTKLSAVWNHWRGYSRLAATYPEAD